MKEYYLDSDLDNEARRDKQFQEYSITSMSIQMEVHKSRGNEAFFLGRFKSAVHEYTLALDEVRYVSSALLVFVFFAPLIFCSPLPLSILPLFLLPFTPDSFLPPSSLFFLRAWKLRRAHITRKLHLHLLFLRTRKPFCWATAPQLNCIWSSEQPTLLPPSNPTTPSITTKKARRSIYFCKVFRRPGRCRRSSNYRSYLL